MSRAGIIRRRDKVFTPNTGGRYSAPDPLSVEGGTAWPDNGRIAAAKPACAEPGCHNDAMTWSRCACGQLFALCADHAVPPRSTSKERAAHNETCPTMKERFAR